MRTTRPHELPPDRQADLRKAKILEWATIAYLASAIVLMYLVMGSSQAMKSAWLEDLLSLVPPIAFLVSVHFRNRPPNPDFPYGYHRVVSIAFLVASLALFAMGAYLLFESVTKLVKAEHPKIGTVELFGLFGGPIWLGWLMLPVLLYSVVPSVFLGRAKLGPARALHDKTLHADATMNKADWMTGAAACVGVLGIAVGWWWADAVAAGVIALDVLRDGFCNVRDVVTDLMDHEPKAVGSRDREELPARIADELKGLDWVRDAEVRLREHGHVFFGEAYIVPTDDRDLIGRSEKALDRAYALDWRLHDLTIQFVGTSESEEATGIDSGRT